MGRTDSGEVTMGFAESLAMEITEKELCIAEHDALEITAEDMVGHLLRSCMLRDGMINLLKKQVSEAMK